jgi:hypothetical protein
LKLSELAQSFGPDRAPAHGVNGSAVADRAPARRSRAPTAISPGPGAAPAASYIDPPVPTNG